MRAGQNARSSVRRSGSCQLKNPRQNKCKGEGRRSRVQSSYQRRSEKRKGYRLSSFLGVELLNDIKRSHEQPPPTLVSVQMNFLLNETLEVSLILKSNASKKRKKKKKPCRVWVFPKLAFTLFSTNTPTKICLKKYCNLAWETK